MSVRKRTWLKGNETKVAWVVDYSDQAGKRRLKTFKLKKDADAFAASSKVEVGQGVHVADTATITIEEAGNLWLKSGDAAGLERTSIDQRRQHLNLHIVPLAGATKLNKITAPWVRSFQDRLREGGRTPAMLKRVTVSLGSILADAQARGLVVRNAVHELSRSRSSARAVEKRQKQRLRIGVDIPTTDEIKAILAASKGRWRPLFLTAVFTGMRASELRGLRWESVDLGGNKITVRERADRYHDIGSPKTEAGHRTIPLLPVVADALTEWKKECPTGDLDLVFPTGAGKVEGHSNIVNRGFLPAQIAAGVAIDTGERDKEGQPILTAKYTGLHALRHWFASWCINRKLDGGLEMTPKAVQERMGHSNIAVTLDTYGHLFPVRDEQQELEAAQQAIFGAT